VDIENPLALHYMMQDDLFFLKEDRKSYLNAVPTAPLMHLVEDELPQQTTPKKPDFVYMGKKGGMLILVHYANQAFIHEGHLTALENILKRKEIAIDKVAVLNMAKNMTAEIEDLLAHFNPEKILILGEYALPIGIEEPVLNQPKQTGNATVLYSFSFDEMMDNPENKKAFWEQMKNF
jgi:DNA polymerase III psi subunit